MKHLIGMSTRHEREKLGTKYRDMSKMLLKVQGNEVCADCGQRDARWCSINLGCFICTNCSGFHRGLGVHLSKVRSVDLDLLTEENYELLKKWGNLKANWYWEGKGNCSLRESSDSFIRGKYEFKRYAREGPVPDPDTIASFSGPASNAPTASASLNLLDFNNMNISASVPIIEPKKQQKLAPVQSSFASFDAFGSNDNTPKAKQPPQQKDQFDFFSTTTANPPPSQKSDKLKSDDILGLFGNTAPIEQPKQPKQQVQQPHQGDLFDFKTAAPVEQPKPIANKSPNIGFDFFGSIQPSPPKVVEQQPEVLFDESPAKQSDLSSQASSKYSPKKQPQTPDQDLFSMASPPKQQAALPIQPQQQDLFSMSPPQKTQQQDVFSVSPPKTVANEWHPKESDDEFGDFSKAASTSSKAISPLKDVEIKNEWHPAQSGTNRDDQFGDFMSTTTTATKAVKSQHNKPQDHFVPDFQDNPWG